MRNRVEQRGWAERDTDSLREGRVLASRYRVGRLIGAGGMCAVHEAEDIKIRRPVAIKVLRPRWRDLGDQVIWREAAITSRLVTPHVVTVLDARTDARFGLFMVMERLRGEDLEARLARGPLPAAEAIEIARQMTIALETAHRARVVHRDFKPGNVFLVDTGDGWLFSKLLDFGVAKAVVSAPGGGPLETLAPPGFTVGTPQYMAPEQATGDCVDERSDVYALGAVLYEAISGSPPEPPIDVRTPPATQTGSWSSAGPRSVPRAPSLSRVAPGTDRRLAGLVDEMLEPDRRHRPRSMREVRARLLRVVNAPASRPYADISARCAAWQGSFEEAWGGVPRTGRA